MARHRGATGIGGAVGLGAGKGGRKHAPHASIPSAQATVRSFFLNMPGFYAASGETLLCFVALSSTVTNQYVWPMLF
jgi:hypothetical protein